MENILKDIGLTETEYLVYITLLKNEECLASDIIKKLKLHRATIYDVLNRLIEKGLTNYIIINNKKYYKAENPNKLNLILNEKKRELNNKEKNVNKIVNELLKIKISDKNKSHICEIYEGKEGLKNIMQEILDNKQTFYSIGGDVRFQEILPNYTKFWAKEREKLKIYCEKIVSEPKKSNWKLNIEKQIPKEYNLPSSTIIYKDKVAIIINKEPLTIIVINDKKVSETYKNHFNMIWKLI